MACNNMIIAKSRVEESQSSNTSSSTLGLVDVSESIFA